eukprot:scaffold332682_cov45-Prasinocladus_malaysianus.AAC.1
MLRFADLIAFFWPLVATLLHLLSITASRIIADGSTTPGLLVVRNFQQQLPSLPVVQSSRPGLSDDEVLWFINQLNSPRGI